MSEEVVELMITIGEAEFILTKLFQIQGLDVKFKVVIDNVT